MSPTRPTNAEIMTALTKLVEMVEQQQPETGVRHELAMMRQDLENRLKRIEEMLGNRGITCPHRDDIRRSANNLTRLAMLEQKMDSLEAQMIKASMLPGAAGGGIGAAIASGLLLLGQHLGWW
jgi:hypothetical protein